MYQTLHEISNKYNITFEQEDITVESDIIVLFNTGDTPHTTNNVMLKWYGMYHYIVKQNYNEAEKFWLESKNNGNILALYCLGILNFYKQNNRQKALEYFLIAVEHGNSSAMNWIGKLYMNGPDTYDEAKKYLLMSVQYDYHLALLNLYTHISKFKLTGDELDILVDYGRKYNDKIKIFDTEKTKEIWLYISEKLNLPCKYYGNYVLKLRNSCKMLKCEICLSDNEKKCIPVNWCYHYVCTDCYMQLYDRPCPFCRQTE